MKEYLKSLLPKLQEFSSTLDTKTFFVNQPWVQVDDNKNKAKYIFNADSTLIVSHNGIASVGSWKYLSGPRNLLVSVGNESLLLNLDFFDRGLMILKKDGFVDDPWVFVNENIVPDLDAERYLIAVFKKKFNVHSERMEDGTTFYYQKTDDYGFRAGTRVDIMGGTVSEGIYNKPGGNEFYYVNNGIIQTIFISENYHTNKGVITVVKRRHTSAIATGNKVLKNGNTAEDGLYELNSHDSAKAIEIQDGRINKIIWKKDYSGLRILIGSLVLILGVLFIIFIQRPESKVDNIQNESKLSDLVTKPIEEPVETVLSASDFDVTQKLKNYFNVVNSNEYYRLESFFSDTLDYYYSRKKILKRAVVDEIKRYTSNVISSGETLFFEDSVAVERINSAYVAKFNLIDLSVLRRNGLPYIYKSATTFVLNSQLKIMSVTGKVVSKKLNGIALLNIKYSENGDLLTLLDRDFFNSVFHKLEFNGYDIEYKRGLKESLFEFVPSSVAVVANSSSSVIYLPELCDKIITGEYSNVFVNNVYSTGNDVYRIEIRCNDISAAN